MVHELTKGKKFYNELNDTPNHPRSYGSSKRLDIIIGKVLKKIFKKENKNFNFST